MQIFDLWSSDFIIVLIVKEAAVFLIDALKAFFPPAAFLSVDQQAAQLS